MKIWIIIGSILIGLGIILGAFASHTLKSKLSLTYLNIFETGVRYQIYHSLGLILLGLLGFHYPKPLINISAKLFIIGILLFSFSLYTLVLTDMRWIGAITPLGGLCFILGWFLLAFKIYKY
jgi:uncharacterized membrane protein YgdD (TMEM256/DUF423 family)